MDINAGGNSRDLLKKLRETLAVEGDGQERLDHIVGLVAEHMGTEVCSIYLRRDRQTLELCATKGLKQESVHQTRLRFGEGLVGLVAKRAAPINAADAPQEKGFRYMPETGEELYTSLLGVPVQRLGEVLGVLVVQNKSARQFSEDDVYALEVVAMVIAEMKELGAFVGDGEAMTAPHQRPHLFKGTSAQEGSAKGVVLLHDPQIVVSNVVADDPEAEKERLSAAMDQLRLNVDDLLTSTNTGGQDQKDVMEAYRMFANSKSWVSRLETSIDRGLTAEVAVEKEQSATRARMARVPDPYLRERLHDLDDLSNRLLRLLTGQGRAAGDSVPENAILVARNIGPAELLEYGKTLKGIVLEGGSVGSHAAIIARAWAIPMVIHADPITREALNNDPILVDGDQGVVHLRPTEEVTSAFQDKIAMLTAAQTKYAAIRNEPATTLDGVTVGMQMNAGLMVDLPSLETSGAEGVGLFRTELQFLMRNAVPKRDELAALYSRVMDAAGDKRVTFRTLDIGSDKVLSYMKNISEPNPAMGWRAIRMGLDKPGVMKMQLQALLRGAKGRPMNIMFPFIAQYSEFLDSRAMLHAAIESEKKLGHAIPSEIKIGAMLETPSLAFAPDQFFETCDFISIGGNDLKQFFYAADRENERVRSRYDTLNVSFLSFIELIAQRCNSFNTPVSFCGEDAGKPVEALCFAAMGLRNLSMRPASIGPVKHMLRKANLAEAKQVIDTARGSGAQSVRKDLMEWLKNRS
ncbi:phosphoenolpyruvate--protein phosphotransferase [Amylibacter kogurei]|uniref:phosphoenolpyruvate--protein phosphotransferase n=1 Tax=Paramylibacter kogurei TaxID=1889778 RepID=A0A2G5K654_9RHOB|nr:phosphoenolpyruvate--protein phosphotransferase [Amylibacter kogurei]PIB24184.1 phosphoenolpyruvate--protein phosphotransferase [Amylibacter kogurei]